MLKVKSIYIVLFAVCAVFMSCDRTQEMLPSPVVPEPEAPEVVIDPIVTDVLSMYHSWEYAQPLPAPPETFTDPNESGSAHGLGERTVYIDGIDHTFFYAVPASIEAGIPIVFPLGMTIVKEIMDDTNTFVWRVAVMQKSTDPMYAAHNGWFYRQYQRESADAPLVAQAGDGTDRGSMGCHGCHAKAAYDSVFVTDILLELGTERLEALGQ